MLELRLATSRASDHLKFGCLIVHLLPRSLTAYAVFIVQYLNVTTTPTYNTSSFGRHNIVGNQRAAWPATAVTP